MIVEVKSEAGVGVEVAHTEARWVKFTNRSQTSWQSLREACVVSRRARQVGTRMVVWDDAQMVGDEVCV